MSFTQAGPCSTPLLQLHQTYLQPGRQNWLLSQTRRGQGLLIPGVICAEACSSCAVLIPRLPHQRSFSRHATLPAHVRLHCVTLPPSVREPWGSSRDGPSVRSLPGKKSGIDGRKEVKMERGRVKEISKLTLLWSKHRLSNPPASAVSLSASISSCRQKGKEKHLRLNWPEVVLFLLYQIGKKKWEPVPGVCTRALRNHKNEAQRGREMFSIRVEQREEVKVHPYVACMYVYRLRSASTAQQVHFGL